MCRFICVALAVSKLAAPAPLDAAWHKASSKHFVIYSEQKPEQLRQFAEKLERFDQAVRKVRGSSDPPIGDGNRLTVIVVKSTSAVQRLSRDKSGTVYGFYTPRYTGSHAFVPARADEDRQGGLNATTVFFHEYSHHMSHRHRIAAGESGWQSVFCSTSDDPGRGGFPTIPYNLSS